MQNVITVKNMRESDAHTIAEYVPSKTLMMRAAMGVFKAADWKGNIGILVGSGNNGGDGYALACILAEEGIPCTLLRVSEKFSPDGQFYYDMARSRGVNIDLYTEGMELKGFDILVDCLLGTGFSGEVRGLFASAIRAINAAHAFVVAVDINSGMNGDTGRAALAVRSDVTVTIGYLKTGMFLGDARKYVGTLIIADIGIRLLRTEYALAAQREIVFPHTNFHYNGEKTRILTPEEVERLPNAGETIPEKASDLALKDKVLVRVLGIHSFVTDGDRGYFIEDGAFPRVISVLD